MRGADVPQGVFFAEHCIRAVADFLNLPVAKVNNRNPPNYYVTSLWHVVANTMQHFTKQGIMVCAYGYIYLCITALRVAWWRNG